MCSTREIGSAKACGYNGPSGITSGEFREIEPSVAIEIPQASEAYASPVKPAVMLVKPPPVLRGISVCAVKAVSKPEIAMSVKPSLSKSPHATAHVAHAGQSGVEFDETGWGIGARYP